MSPTRSSLAYTTKSPRGYASHSPRISPLSEAVDALSAGFETAVRNLQGGVDDSALRDEFIIRTAPLPAIALGGR